MSRKDVLAAAKRAGYAERTIERARGRCSISVRTAGFGRDRSSIWALPDITANPSTPDSRGSYGSNGSNQSDEGTITAITAKAANRHEAESVAVMDRLDTPGAEDYRAASRGR